MTRELLTIRKAERWLAQRFPDTHTPSHVTIGSAIFMGEIPFWEIPVGSRSLYILDGDDVLAWFGKWKVKKHRGPKRKKKA